MKRKLTFAASVVCVLAVICTVVAFNNNIGIKVRPLDIPGSGDHSDFDNTNFKIKHNIKFDETADIYKFKKLEADSNFVKKLAKQFNISVNNKIDDSGDNFFIEDNNGCIRVEKGTCMWSYNKKQIEGSSDNIIISNDDKVIEIAKKELNKYKIDISSFCKPIVTNQTETKAGETDSKIIAKDIYFYKSFNGKPVLGTSRIIVTIGNNDEVLTISKYYREVEETGYKVKLKKKDDMVKEIKSNKTLAQYGGEGEIPENIEITSAELCYWEDSSNDFLQPVYVMKGNDTNNVSDNFSVYIPAVEEGQTVK